MISIKICIPASFSSFGFGSAFYSPIMFIFLLSCTMLVILYLKRSNFLIFGNEQNRSESEEPKRKSIGIAYLESKPFRSEFVTCLIAKIDKIINVLLLKRLEISSLKAPHLSSMLIFLKRYLFINNNNFWEMDKLF